MITSELRRHSLPPLCSLFVIDELKVVLRAIVDDDGRGGTPYWPGVAAQRVSSLEDVKVTFRVAGTSAPSAAERE